MSSTRNKNSPGNYVLEQDALRQQRQYEMYTGYRLHDQTYLPGDGLLPARCPMQLFDTNCDTESMLLGIGSSNLVAPKTVDFSSDIPQNYMKSLSIIDKPRVVLPEPLVVDRDQRFMPK